MNKTQRAATIKATIAAALLVGACLQSLRLGQQLSLDNFGVVLTLLPFLPLPYGLMSLRYGPHPAIAAGLGLFGGVTVIALSAGQPTDISLVIGLCAALSVGGLGVVIWAAGFGRPLQRHALLGMSVACALVIAIPTVMWIANSDRAQVRDRQSDITQRYYQRVERELKCATAKGVTKKYCNTTEIQGEHVVSIVKKWGVTLLIALLTISIVPLASTMLFLARWLGVRNELPIQRNAPASSFQVHWSVAYLVAASLMVLLVGLQGAADNWYMVAGVAGLSLGGLLLVTSGFCVVLAVFRARREVGLSTAGMWIVTLVMIFLAMPLALSAFATIGVADLLLDVRSRLRGRIDADK
jgi:hypothetical protein